jgi:hypothetical protein
MAQQYQMDGAGSVPKVGTVKDGKMWNGTKWVLLSDAPTIPSKPTPVPNTVIPAPTSTKTSPYAPRTEAQKAADQLALNANAQLATFENAQASGKPMPGYVPTGGGSNGGGGSSGASAYTGGSGSPAPAQLMSYQRPDLRGGQALADLYGLTYGKDNIEKVLNEATNAKFNEWDAQGRKLRDQQLTDYASQYDQYLQYARQNRDRALKSGLSRGSAVSQDIMSQVAAQKNGAENQAFYQQGLADLVNQRGTQLGSDKFNAMNMANEQGLALGGLDANLYQSDTAGLTGFQQYLASMAQSEAQVKAAGIQAGASNYAANQGYNAAALAGGGGSIVDYAKKLGLDPDLEADFITGKISATEATKEMSDRKSKSTKTPRPTGVPTYEEIFKNGGF